MTGRLVPALLPAAGGTVMMAIRRSILGTVLATEGWVSFAGLGMRPWTIAVNGAFVRKEVTGVQRAAHELLAALEAAGDPRFRFITLIPAPPRGDRQPERMPAGEVAVDRSRLPGALWMQVRLPGLARRIGAAARSNAARSTSLTFTPRLITSSRDSASARSHSSRMYGTERCARSRISSRSRGVSASKRLRESSSASGE